MSLLSKLAKSATRSNPLRHPLLEVETEIEPVNDRRQKSSEGEEKLAEEKGRKIFCPRSYSGFGAGVLLYLRPASSFYEMKAANASASSISGAYN